MGGAGWEWWRENGYNCTWTIKKKSPGVLTSADPLVQRPQMSVAKAWKHAFLKENYSHWTVVFIVLWEMVSKMHTFVKFLICNLDPSEINMY